MNNHRLLYWLCQAGGWLFYALTMVFFAYWFEQSLNPFFWKRLLLFVSLGVLSTHLLRYLIHVNHLLPPIKGSKWVLTFLMVVLVCILFSLSSSVLIQLLGWYIKSYNGNIQKRFVYNFLFDSPIILVWVSIYYLWHYVDDARKTEMDKIKLETLVKELELKTIKSHINPHFIFNALNSIRALVDENPERARTAITELSNLLRSSMQADTAEITSLERELNIVKDYLALEHIRFEDRLKVEYEIDEDTLDQPVPPMMLQTLVENAIKHGISKQKEGGTIKLISDFKGDVHEILVQNTGKLTEAENENGFGIMSTKNRLSLLFGHKASFNLHKLNDNLVEAKITLPVQI
jgi:sensor histidine kinase YesM